MLAGSKAFINRTDSMLRAPFPEVHFDIGFVIASGWDGRLAPIDTESGNRSGRVGCADGFRRPGAL